MTPEQKFQVQETWEQVAPIADAASGIFYDRLFEIDPDLRALFAGTDMAHQRRKLIQAISTVVGALDRFEEIELTIADLGRRHVAYGVTDAHYGTVGAALLWTLEQGLGDAWTADVKAAWIAAYTAISDVMRSAAAEVDECQAATAAAAR